MKTADGGFRPAYKVQLAPDAATGRIVDVNVTNNGTDQPRVVPMLDDIAACAGRTPDEYLVEGGGFVTHGNIEAVSARGATIYAPPAKSQNPKIDPCEPNKDDPPAVAAWRLRMKTEDAKQIYVQRCAVAERTNVESRHRRTHLRLRHLVVLLHAQSSTRPALALPA